MGTSGNMQIDTVSLNDRQLPSPQIDLADNAWHIIQMASLNSSGFAFPLQVDGFKAF